ncbi:hypothetical protein DERF_010438 [Dermatophagoides farinae]|uniref:Uncharacterized protein n=1 Tax=Dermatophagoides farinae TaxID=6954 RepID=A0A922I038_DERFA|nr:hypothetical protein DERF_010438 [Dermatophagoides farinae]
MNNNNNHHEPHQSQQTINVIKNQQQTPSSLLWYHHRNHTKINPLPQHYQTFTQPSSSSMIQMSQNKQTINDMDFNVLIKLT